MRVLLAAIVLAGCLSNPTVQVDKQSLDVPRGTHEDVLVSIDHGAASLDEVVWTVDDEQIATVTVASDGSHLRVGGDLEGDTVVHVFAYGQDLAIATHVGAPAVLKLWTEPERIDALVGSQVQVKAKILDTLARVVDVTFTSRWQVRDETVVDLDKAGMMLHAMGAGETTLHVSHDGSSAVVPVAVFP